MVDWQESTRQKTAAPTGDFGAGAERTSASAVLGGTHVDLRWFDEAVIEIMSAANHPHGNPLAVVSANLDHVMHFGAGGRWGGALDTAESINWLTLLDGAPLRAKATALTGQQWPRLAGSDLIHPLLDAAQATSLRVGFLGGTEQTHQLLRAQFAKQRPTLQVSGWWAPERAALANRPASVQLAQEVEQAGTDILVVGLGKPRQELWIAQYGAMTGASVLLAFGAVVDFLAGRIPRAPQAVVDAGMEWAWRLAMEPRRLAQRYLVQGPEAYMRMNLHSKIGPCPKPAGTPPGVEPDSGGQDGAAHHEGRVNAFVPADCMADVTVVVVTYNNVGDVDPLVEGLRTECGPQSLKVIVADNGSTDGTVERIAAHTDIILVRTGGNLGYAGGINAALKLAGPHHDVLVLNPDLRLLPGAIGTLRRRMRRSGAGIVVPRLLDHDDTTYPSLRREPSLVKAMGDAVFGQKFSGRPDWLSEIDFNDESYQFPHLVDWATGAALLISGEVVAELGDWDERYFLYSEETDYFHRARLLGHSAWFEPSASMVHSRGGSGTSPDLSALMAVNRVRYAQAHHSGGYAALVRAIGVTAGLARFHKPGSRKAVLALAGAVPWSSLPKAVLPAATAAPGAPESPAPVPPGAVIIPAHNEAAVIARTLRPLAALAACGAVEVIVACNGCTDRTAKIAASFPGVLVLDLPASSKTAALNAADAACSHWPRLYLDADIEIDPSSVAAVFRYLCTPGSLAARPAFRYELQGADPIVRAYYRARMRIPAMNGHLWGAGAYAVNEAGHSRFPQFPDTTADDAYIDSLFEASEKAILPTDPVVVRVPLRFSDLHKTLRRIYRGVEQLGAAPTPGTGLGPVVRSVTGPLALVDAGIYASMAVAGKLRSGQSRTSHGGWDRDESTRTG